MRQLIARIDEGLHARLKRAAEREGRSVNSLVIESLTRTVDELEVPETPLRWKSRMIAQGRVVIPPQPEQPVDREAAIAATRGWGTKVSEQLERDRDHW